MQVKGKPYQSIWFDETKQGVMVIDQRKLPFQFEVLEIESMEAAYRAIQDMTVRGAPLIGVTAAYGLYLAIKNDSSPTLSFIESWAKHLKSARPTAVNLESVIDKMVEKLAAVKNADLKTSSLKLAREAEDCELHSCERIGEHGLHLIENIAKKKNGNPINILTHCNAGWLACVDWGTATAPIYKAHLKGIPVHVWVDETRPRNQGARLTAWELESAGIPYTVIPDNTGGHLMQHQQVDLVLVGSDRTTLNGDVANKIGTYLKALAANDNNIPFYVALPSSSIDFTMVDGVNNIPIEQRSADEVRKMDVWVKNQLLDAWIMPEQTPVANYGFDVTPARLVTGLITERGICRANRESILELFPEKRK